MNPIDRLVAANEQMAAAHVAANERLGVVLVLLAVGVGIGILVLLVLTVTSVRRRHEHVAIMDGIRRLEAGYAENWELLKLVKGWAESARAHSKDAALAVKEVKAQSPEAERHVLEAVEGVPDKTAAVVVQKLEEFKKLLVPPLVLVAAMGGPTAASQPASAADDMRREGEANARAWWADQQPGTRQ